MYTLTLLEQRNVGAIRLTCQDLRCGQGGKGFGSAEDWDRRTAASVG